jgi:hypothetical protein
MVNYETIEFRLTYIQTLIHPAGGVLQFALVVLFGIGGYIAAKEAGTHISFTLLAVCLYASCVGLLLYRSPRRRLARTLCFTPQGVVFDLADCVIRSDVGTDKRLRDACVPYCLLTVHRGLAGVAVLKALSGHFVLIPEAILPAVKLKQKIALGKGVQLSEGAPPHGT